MRAGNRSRSWLQCLMVLVTVLAAHGAAADEVQVAVASNFRETLIAVAIRFEQRSGHELTLITGSTGKHYAQIVNGAPFDAFFAADTRRPRLLEQAQRIVAGSRFTYAVGKLVLWSPQDQLVDPHGEVLRNGNFHHLAIANPELAPYGAAARQLLQALGLWESLAGKLVRGENIGQAYQFVFSGNAELGLVARAQMRLPGRTPVGSAWEPPQSLYDPIEQQAVLLRDTPAGRAFVAFMQDKEARALIRSYGYDVPDVQ